MTRFVYRFGSGEADGRGDQKELLGGKGANLAEMTALGIPVPPGFTLTTEVCNLYEPETGFPEGLDKQVVGALERRAEIDDVIQTASRNWRIERMSRVDRNILRLAASELMGSPEVPTKVVINEAVELAKRFGAAEAPAFVNGILDRIAQGVRKGT